MTQQRAKHDVFTDLGFAPAEAENLRIRSAMMRALVAFIRERKLTQAHAATLLGVTQPRVSDLMRGKIHLFSIDNLVVLLAAAGLRVDLRFKKAGRWARVEVACSQKVLEPSSGLEPETC